MLCVMVCYCPVFDSFEVIRQVSSFWNGRVQRAAEDGDFFQIEASAIQEDEFVAEIFAQKFRNA